MRSRVSPSCSSAAKTAEGNYRLTVLANGARVASASMPHMKSVTVGVWFGVGGRHESSDETGLSHFVEHLLFKGTRKRTARQITESVEGVGGFINAFTSEDHTCYYAKAAAKFLPLLCDVLMDMVLDSQFAEDEIVREREIVREEIRMYRDQPCQQAQEVLLDLMWPNHPLGRPITGSEESLATFDQAAVRDFVAANYNAGTILVTVAGCAEHDEVLRQIAPLLLKLRPGQEPAFSLWQSANWRPGVRVIEEDTEQAHLSMASHTISRNDDRRYALKLLNVMLGENMSSRLFQQLRERHGYCYSIQSETMTLNDTGLVNISAGFDSENLRSALKLILREYERLGARPVSARELRQAKDYTVGHNDLSLESTTHQMMWIGESILAYGRIVNPVEVQDRIQDVTAVQVQEVAQLSLSRENTSLVVIGKGLDQEKVEAWMR